jgi:hypothetical protein
MMNRRDVLGLAVSAGAAVAMSASRADERATQLSIIDTNVSLCRWPFRRLPLDEPDALVKKLRSLGVTLAWAGSFEGLLHRDISAVNRRLAEACRTRPELIPIGSINPTLPGWEQNLKECGEHRMPGVRLHPNYHGYVLDDARFAKLLVRATKAGLFVQVAAAMEDARTQSDKLQVSDVDLSPLAKTVARVAQARVQILNARLRAPQWEALSKVDGIFFDTARVDSTDGVPKLVRGVPAGRVLFGSHAPFLIPEAALIRVHESGQLDEASLRAVYQGNAAAFEDGGQA